MCCQKETRAASIDKPKQDNWLVINSVKRGERPDVCPSCSKSNVAPPLMCGHVFGEEVRWVCINCSVRLQYVLWGCDWCCEEREVTLRESKKRFCGVSCHESWKEAKEKREKKRHACGARF